MIKYVKEVLCSNNDNILNHLLKIEAKMVRGQKNDCCIYLKGPQGVGKSTHVEFLRDHVLGRHMCCETGSAPLKNRFNSEFAGKIMVSLEELENFGAAEWISISSTLKRWITSPTIQIEAKGKDAIEHTNLITFWLLSNNDAIQDDDGRRYFILPVSAKYRMNDAYFAKVRSCFNDEVGQAYYSYLMEIDITNFNSQKYPVTSAKIDSYSKRLDNNYKFLKECYILHRKGIDKILFTQLYEDYVAYCEGQQSKHKNKIDLVNILRTLE